MRIKLAKYHEAIGPLKKALELDPTNARAEEVLEDAEAGRQRIDYVGPKNTNSNANANANAGNSNTASNSNTNTAPTTPPPANTRPTPDPNTQRQDAHHINRRTGAKIHTLALSVCQLDIRLAKITH